MQIRFLYRDGKVISYKKNTIWTYLVVFIIAYVPYTYLRMILMSHVIPA